MNKNKINLAFMLAIMSGLYHNNKYDTAYKSHEGIKGKAKWAKKKGKKWR